MDERGFFWTGFFLGLLWFYWIALSFTHYGFWYLIPFGILGIGLFYGVLFWFCGIFHSSPWVKGALVFGLGILAPFGFNWLDWRILLLHTPFDTTYLALALVLGGIAWFMSISGKKRFIGLVFFFLALDQERTPPPVLPFDIALVSTQVPQSHKWEKAHQAQQIAFIKEAIHTAIAQQKRAIVFPESALPLYLNHHHALLKELKELSHAIGIFVGALSAHEEGIYNSTYFFDKGSFTVAHKVILVPFGEVVPFPKPLRDFINNLFYGGASDFLVAAHPSDFAIEGVYLRNAICFEATKPLLFAKNPSFMVASSNNAWFAPSLQPTLQHLLLTLYATNHNTLIYHSANGSPGGVISPRPSKTFAFMAPFEAPMDYLKGYFKSP